ncbi:MAG: hypothetical protein HY747_01650 [Elusimicrobia bacterium]|nr:hypothetical protein [Elusimicrobiota bacterium]
MEELLEEFDVSLKALKELVKEHKALRQDNAQLHSLVVAMESDHKKASHLINEHEKLGKDRDRVRQKIGEIIGKLDKLKI